MERLFDWLIGCGFVEWNVALVFGNVLKVWLRVGLECERVKVKVGLKVMFVGVIC